MKNVSFAALEAQLALWEAPGSPGGQILVRHHGETVYERCAGLACLELSAPIVPETRFNIASNSKQFTVMAILMLMEEGKLRLDDDVRRYLPDLVAFDEPLTLHQCMTNTGGVRDVLELLVMSGRRADDTMTRDDVARMLARQTGLNFAPGSRYLYSNSHFFYLVEIVERVSGMRYPDFARTRIFEPLHMHDTVVQSGYAALIPHRATSYHDDGTRFLNHVFNCGYYGDGNIWSTARDLAAFAAHHEKPFLIRPETAALMQTPPVLTGGGETDYACALRVGSLDGHRYLCHGGADASFRSQFFCFPEDKLEVVVLTNTVNLTPDALAETAARCALGLPDAPQSASLPGDPAFDLADAPGLYMLDTPDGAMTFTVSGRGEALFLRDDYGPAPLTPLGGGCFRLGRRPLTLRLGPDPSVWMGGKAVPLTKYAPQPLPERRYARYEGVYESAELGTRYAVVLRGGALFTAHPFGGERPLLPLGGERFLMELTDGSAVLTFVRGSGGSVIGARLDGSRVLGVPLSKLAPFCN